MFLQASGKAQILYPHFIFSLSLSLNTANHKNKCHLLYSYYSLHLLNGIVEFWKARNQSFTDILLNSGDNALNVVGSQSEYFKSSGKYTERLRDMSDSYVPLWTVLVFILYWWGLLFWDFMNNLGNYINIISRIYQLIPKTKERSLYQKINLNCHSHYEIAKYF